MTYNFFNLSHADFEDLVRDLLSAEIGVRFEGFRPGPDGGVDGRHSKGTKKTIIQAKHYAESQFRTLKAAIRKERPSIDKLAANRYILVTSQALSPPNKKALAEIIGPTLQSEGDIFGRTELNALLRKFPDIERANIKLWLSSTAVLERVVHSALHAYTSVSRAEIEAKVRVYAQNPSFKEARDRLEVSHVVIISGPPGVGKTTLAEMLAYAYIGEEWEFVAIRSLDDGFSELVDAKKKIFFFDDFLGKISLDAHALAAKDSELAKFIKRVRHTANTRFILTTRAPLFEEARQISEYLADDRLDVSKYVLDVGLYTRRIKARILYNHLFVSDISKKYVKALWDTGSISRIIDHPNYNPRLIEAMTDNIRIKSISANAYPKAFIDTLNDPSQIWDITFRNHIPQKCQHLLLALFFSSQYGISIDEFKPAYETTHHYLCRKYSIQFGPKDFSEALKTLEGGFVTIRGTSVTFINPSVRDYLANYLNDLGMLFDFAQTSTTVQWAASVWQHAGKCFSSQDRLKVLPHMLDIASRFPVLPVTRAQPNEPGTYYFCDTGIAGRIELLLEWWNASHEDKFIEYAIATATKPLGGFSPWQDTRTIVDVLHALRTDADDDERIGKLAGLLEDAIVTIAGDCYWPDDIERLWKAIEGKEETLGDEIFAAAEKAIAEEFEELGLRISGVDSQSTLEDQIETLKRLAVRVAIPDATLKTAISAVETRIETIKEDVEEAPAPSFSGKLRRENEKFDNTDLANLFGPLAGKSGPMQSAIPIDLDSEIPF